MTTDQHARAQALTPDQSYIVQAPAGSGKTELLTQRILSLLANNAKSPEAVLAITFTRKAAHEMRLRVLKALQAGRDPNEPTASHQRLTWNLARRVLEQDALQGWNLLDNPQRLQVMTIDSFCASLVRQMPVLSEMGGMPTISDNPGHLYFQAARTTVIDLLNSEDESLQTLLLHLDNRQHIAVNYIANMLSKREQWLPVLMMPVIARYSEAIQTSVDCFAPNLIRGRNEALRELLEGNLAKITADILEHLVEQLDLDLFESLKPLLRFALDNVEPGILPPELEDVFDWPWSLETFKALYQYLFTTTGSVRKAFNKNQGFPAPSAAKDKAEKALLTLMKENMKAWVEAFSNDAVVLEAWQAVPYLPDPVYADSQWEVLLALLHVLPHACAQLQIHLQTHSEIDFSGVAQAAHIALGHADDPSALTLKLDYQLQHILIDEFQDTSLQQYALIEKLIAGWMPGDGRTLFLVGDPMQSIYRFRQAEVGLFIRVQEQGLGDLTIKPLQLTANFRSDPAVIDWINQHAVGCFSADQDINLGAVPYSPSEAARESKPGSGVSVHATGNVIPCLQQLLADENIQSIAILVRARSHLSTVSAALKAEQIPYQAVELEGLAVQSLVQDLISLTRAWVHLADAIAWLSVLRAPFCGFSLADITVIRETDLSACVWDNLNAVDLSKLSQDGQNIWQRVQPIFAAYLQNRMNGRLSLAIEHLWIALGGPLCVEHESELQLATSYFGTLAKYEKGGTLPDIHRMMDSIESAYVKSAAGTSRIQIMTLHKSKGLEFDAVLLPELQRDTRGRDQSLLLWEQFPTDAGQSLLIAPIQSTQGEKDPLYAFLKYTRQQKEAHENGRLLYVGMTRAKRQLHLFGRLTQHESGEILPPKEASLLSLIWPTLADDFTLVFDPIESESLISTKTFSKPFWRLSPDWVSPHALPSVQEGDNTVSIEAHSYAAHVQRQQGVLLHRMLYKIAIQGLPLWDTLDIDSLVPSLEAQLRELGVMRGVNGVAQSLVDVLKNVLKDSRGRWILHAHERHEAEAVYGSSIIDRTFIDETGQRWIIDYKTSSDFADSQDEQYRRQLARYAQIFVDQGEENIKCALYYPLFSGWKENP